MGSEMCIRDSLGTTKVTPGKNPDLRDRPGVQASVSQAKAELSSARMYLYHCVDLLWAAVKDGQAPDKPMLSDVWSAAIHAATTSRQVLSNLYAAAGTVSLYNHFPIERAHRDIHAVLQHGIVQPHWLNQTGLVYMGSERVSPMFET